MKSLLILCLLPINLWAQQADITFDKKLNRIAFGSCSKQDQPDKQLWHEINQVNPDLWIWLGDNIYADTEDMTLMRQMYDQQKTHPGYQELLKNTDVIGIWDDHDYGVNDGGSEYLMKDQSKAELFRFLDVNEDHPAWKRKGAHQSYSYKSADKIIKIILLDARYFRDTLKWNNPGTPEKEALINKEGNVLGEVQWNWLAGQLSEEGVDLFIVCSGIQVIAEQHRWEKWSNFPKARKRLLDVVKQNTKAPLVFLTGDRHLSEVSRTEIDGYPYPIWDLTSSSLTSPSGIGEELNKYRIGKKIHDPNFAFMDIAWSDGLPQLNLVFQGKDNKEFQRQQIKFK